MKVLIVPSWYPSELSPTAGIFVAQQARAMVRQGIDTAVIHVTKDLEGLEPTAEYEDGVLTIRARYGCPPPQTTFIKQKIAGIKFRLSRALQLRSLVESCASLLDASDFAPDVIHVHALWPAARQAIWISRRHPAPIVVTEHSIEYLPKNPLKLLKTPGMLQLVLRPLARHAKVFIAVSDYFAQVLRDLKLHDDIRVVPNIVPVLPAIARPANGPQRMVNVSHLTPAKNIPLLINAIEIVARHRQDFVLDLVGDGMLRRDLEEMVESAGLECHVEFRGLMSAAEVREVIGQSSFGVLSSNFETFSVFAAECLMAGRPVLTTDIGGPTSFVDSSVGRITKADDVAAMAESMLWMLDHANEFDPVELHEYTAARFSDEAVVPQLLAIYREVACL